MKYFFLGAIIFVIGAIGIGLYFSGTPGTARAERLDDIRVSDLSNVQANILYFYQNNKRLPNDMKEVVNFQGATFYLDPETKILYEYEKRSDTQFSLCAHFRVENFSTTVNYPYAYYPAPGAPGLVGETGWQHTTGRFCFERTINPQLLNQPNFNLPPIKG